LVNFSRFRYVLTRKIWQPCTRSAFLFYMFSNLRPLHPRQLIFCCHGLPFSNLFDVSIFIFYICIGLWQNNVVSGLYGRISIFGDFHKFSKKVVFLKTNVVVN
jgi:hypothetical protein